MSEAPEDLPLHVAVILPVTVLNDRQGGWPHVYVQTRDTGLCAFPHGKVRNHKKPMAEAAKHFFHQTRYNIMDIMLGERAPAVVPKRTLYEVHAYNYSYVLAVYMIEVDKETAAIPAVEEVIGAGGQGDFGLGVRGGGAVPCVPFGAIDRKSKAGFPKYAMSAFRNSLKNNWMFPYRDIMIDVATRSTYGVKYGRYIDFKHPRAEECE